MEWISSGRRKRERPRTRWEMGKMREAISERNLQRNNKTTAKNGN